MTEFTQREEVSATHRWIIGLVLTIIIQSGAVFFWAATIQAQVQQNAENIEDALTQDQAALIIQQIEQLKDSVETKNKTIEKLDERLRLKGI